MAQTLEQLRAADAWKQVQGQDEPYKNLAKALPALIMNSGLVQVLAFLEDKGKRHHVALGSHLRSWLHNRFPGQLASDQFNPFLLALIETGPQDYQRITGEAQAWLRWVRQIAPAVIKS